MDGSQWFWIAAVAIVTVAFLNYPAPELTPRLKAWLKRGNFFDFKGFKIFYIVERGEAEDDSALVLIHGFPTASYDWYKVLDGVKTHYGRVVMLDMLGYGFSDKPKDHDYLIMEQADIVEALLGSLGISESHVISHDYGDTVALELLARHNEQNGKVALKTLCMLNGGVFPETNFPRPIQKLLQIPYLGAVLSRLSFYQMFKRGFGDVFGVNTKPTEEEFRDFYGLSSYNKGYLVSSRLIDYIAQRSVHKERWVGALQRSAIPVHMIYGPSDPVNPPVFIDHYKKVVPNPSIEVLGKDIGHYPQVEDPENVLKSYTVFIQKHRS